jgi:hypothetical protein
MFPIYGSYSGMSRGKLIDKLTTVLCIRNGSALDPRLPVGGETMYEAVQKIEIGLRRWDPGDAYVLWINSSRNEDQVSQALFA